MSHPASAVDENHLTFSRWAADTLVRWRVVVKTLLLVYVAGLVAVLVVPPVYRSRASFVANSSGAPKLPAGMTSTGPLAGIASQLGVSTISDPSESPNFYLELIESRELLTRLLLSKFKNPRSDAPHDSATLVDILKLRSSDPRRRLELGIKRMTSDIVSDFSPKTNLVWINVDAEWPDLSADVANRTIGLVTAFNREQRVSRARSKRIFLEERVDSAKMLLHDAEERQRQFYGQNRLWRNSPDLTFEEGRLRREAETATDLYLTLERQLESARLDEFNDAALITVVDSAVAPRKAQWPRYGVLLLTATAVGLILGLLIAGSKAVLSDWAQRNPRAAADVKHSVTKTKADLRAALALSRRQKRREKAVS